MTSSYSERNHRRWADPVQREKMLLGCTKATEASRNLNPRTRAEIGIRVSRTFKRKQSNGK